MATPFKWQTGMSVVRPESTASILNLFGEEKPDQSLLAMIAETIKSNRNDGYDFGKTVAWGRGEPLENPTTNAVGTSSVKTIGFDDIITTQKVRDDPKPVDTSPEALHAAIAHERSKRQQFEIGTNEAIRTLSAAIKGLIQDKEMLQSIINVQSSQIARLEKQVCDDPAFNHEQMDHDIKAIFERLKRAEADDSRLEQTIASLEETVRSLNPNYGTF